MFLKIITIVVEGTMQASLAARSADGNAARKQQLLYCAERLRRRARTLLLMCASLLLVGCTVPYRIPLEPAHSAQLMSATVYARVDHRGVGVEYQGVQTPYNDPSKGLTQVTIQAFAAALVKTAFDYPTVSKAEASAKKLIGAGFDHAGLTLGLQRSLQSQLGTVPLFDLAPLVKPLDWEREWLVSNFNENTVVLVSAEHALTPDLRSLDIAVVVVILSRTPAKGYKAPARTTAGNTLVYRNRFEYHSMPLEESHFESSDARVDEYVSKWTENNAALIHRELRDGFGEIAKLIVFDLQQGPTFDKAPRTVVNREGERVTVRFNQGSLPGTLSSEPANYARPPSNNVVYVRK